MFKKSLVLAFFFFIAAKGQNQSERRVSLVPQWVPQSQFAGFYIAAHKGIYKQYGLDVEILEGGPDHPASELILRDEAQFCTLWLSEAIKFNNEQNDENQLVNLAQIFQTSSEMIITKKQSGINSLEDLNYQSIQIYNSEFYYLPKAFFKKHNLQVKLIPQVRSMNLFLWDGVKAALVMEFNEYHRVVNSGINPEEMTTFPFSENGFDFPEDGIYCKKQYFENHPVTCSLFVKASLEGWRYALANPDETLDIMTPIIKSAYTGSNYVHERWMLKTVRKLIYPPNKETRLGYLNREEFENLTGLMRELGFIDKDISYDSFYKGKELIRVQE